MEVLEIAGAVAISIGILLLLFMLSESQDCAFDVERVNLICAEGDNVSEKALFVILSAFAIILGAVLLRTNKQVNG